MSEILDFKCWKVRVPKSFEFYLEFELLEIWKSANLEIGNWNIELLIVCNLKFEVFKSWNCEILKSWNFYNLHRKWWRNRLKDFRVCNLSILSLSAQGVNHVHLLFGSQRWNVKQSEDFHSGAVDYTLLLYLAALGCSSFWLLSLASNLTPCEGDPEITMLSRALEGRSTALTTSQLSALNVHRNPSSSNLLGRSVAHSPIFWLILGASRSACKLPETQSVALAKMVTAIAHRSHLPYVTYNWIRMTFIRLLTARCGGCIAVCPKRVAHKHNRLVNELCR